MMKTKKLLTKSELDPDYVFPEEVIRIFSNGRVGLGLNSLSPSAKLHITSKPLPPNECYLKKEEDN